MFDGEASGCRVFWVENVDAAKPGQRPWFATTEGEDGFKILYGRLPSGSRRRSDQLSTASSRAVFVGPEGWHRMR